MSDLFESKPEPSEGEPVEPSQGEPSPPSEGEPKKQEGTPQWYKSQLDKSQSEYNKKLQERQQAWDREKNELLGKFGQLQKQFEEIKAPKEEALEYPQRPQRPSDFDLTDAVTDPNSTSAKYQNALESYEQKKDEYFTKKDSIRDKELNSLKSKLVEADRLKMAQEQREFQKAHTIGAFQKEGLSPEESVDLWKILDGAFSAPIDEGSKVFAEFYKARKSKPSDKEKQFDKRKDKREQFLPPGYEGAGGIPPDDDSEKFMKEMGGKKKEGLFNTK